jgi:hypothetical protein
MKKFIITNCPAKEWSLAEFKCGGVEENLCKECENCLPKNMIATCKDYLNIYVNSEDTLNELTEILGSFDVKEVE